MIQFEINEKEADSIAIKWRIQGNGEIIPDGYTVDGIDISLVGRIVPDEFTKKTELIIIGDSYGEVITVLEASKSIKTKINENWSLGFSWEKGDVGYRLTHIHEDGSNYETFAPVVMAYPLNAAVHMTISQKGTGEEWAEYKAKSLEEWRKAHQEEAAKADQIHKEFLEKERMKKAIQAKQQQEWEYSAAYNMGNLKSAVISETPRLLAGGFFDQPRTKEEWRNACITGVILQVPEWYPVGAYRERFIRAGTFRNWTEAHFKKELAKCLEVVGRSDTGAYLYRRRTA